MKLIVNIPAYNEEKVIGKTIERIKKSFENDFYLNGKGKIISEKLIQVVDDGSSDNTAGVCKNNNVDLLISYYPNKRLAYSFKRAVESAIENGADIMVNIDADGQFDPEDIPKLIQPILEKKSEMVVASRFGKHKAENIPWMKNFLNQFAAKTIGFFLGRKIDDLTCGFRALSFEAFLRLNLTNTNFTYTQETIIDAIGKNLKLQWVPVRVTYFDERQSKIVSSVWKFINNSSKIILKAIRDVRPLKFFGWPGIIFLSLGVISFVIFLVNYFISFKISPYLNYVIFSAITLLVGIQLIIFALIADMIKSNRQITEDLLYRQKIKKWQKAKNNKR